MTLRALLATPVRQFQVLGVLGLTAAAWVGLSIGAFQRSLPRGGLAQTFAELAAGEMGTRWASFYLLLVTWISIVLVYALTAWGVGLAVHSIIRAGREAAVGKLPSGGDSYVPAPFVFWGGLALGGVAYSVSLAVAPVTSAPVWDDWHGATLLATFVWWAVAAATVGAALVRLDQRRRYARERAQRRAEGRARAAERRAAAKQARRTGRSGS